MNYLVPLLVMVGFTGCGVDTASSGVPSSIDIVVEDVVTSDSNETNTTQDVVVSDTNDTTTTNTDTTTDEDREPIFESSGAVYDENACNSSWATAPILQDNNENDDRETSDDANGIAVMSYYTETGYVENSNVIVYYKTITGETGNLAFRKNGYFDNSQFRIEYDPVWITEPNNTIYVETPKLDNELKTCYKIIINSDDISNTEQKVYRY